MRYAIKLTKKQKEKFKQEIMDKLQTLEGSELQKAKDFFDKMNDYRREGHISYAELLTILKAKLLGDPECKRVIHEVLNVNILEFDIEKAIADFLEAKELLKDPKERIKMLEEGQSQTLENRRELETLKTGLDPNPIFLGLSEDKKESVYEIYLKCWNCAKVFKTFKQSQWFCSAKCRQDWVSKNQKSEPLVQEVWSERNCESWNWQRIGNETSKELGTYGIFKRVFKNEKQKGD